jgi:predicted MFS family arabinose efflux permease
MMSLFYTGIPVGAALGFGIGALVSNSFGWRVAFTVVGIPGIVLAFSILFTKDPERGQMDDPAEYKLKHAQKHLNNWGSSNP